MKPFSEVLHNLRPHTARAYDQAWRDLAGHLGGLEQLASLTTHQVESWVAGMRARGLSAATIRVRLSAVSALFEKGDDPTASIARPTPPKRRETPLAARQTENLLAAIDRDTPHGRQDFALLGLILLTGWKVEKVRTLCWADLTFKNGKMYLKDGPERIQLPMALWRTIATLMQDTHGSTALHPGTYLFVAIEGFGCRNPKVIHTIENKPLSRQDINRRILRYARLAGIDTRMTSRRLAVAGKTIGRAEVFVMLENLHLLKQPVNIPRNLRTWSRISAG